MLSHVFEVWHHKAIILPFSVIFWLTLPLNTLKCWYNAIISQDKSERDIGFPCVAPVAVCRLIFIFPYENLVIHQLPVIQKDVPNYLEFWDQSWTIDSSPTLCDAKVEGERKFTTTCHLFMDLSRKFKTNRQAKFIRLFSLQSYLLISLFVCPLVILFWVNS